MSKLPYQNESLSIEERIDDLMNRMSIEEKVKQLTCAMYIPVMPIEKQDLKDGIGSFTIMGSQNVAGDIRKAQEYVIEHSEHGIPALVHGEALSGPVSIPAANLFPTSISLGATFEPEMAEKMSEGTRKQMYAVGMRHALSPVADLGRDLRFGRCSEGYGEDPTLGAAMTVAFVKGLQGEDLKEGIACTGKHFLGYSQSENAMNMHKSLATPRELREVFAKPFEAAIHMADMKCVMNCYSEVEGQPMCANKKILTDMLRDDMGFEGLVVSDYNSIRHVMHDFKLTDNMLDASRLCLEAGLDVELPTRMGYNDQFAEAVKNGDIDIAYVDRSVRRVLKLKFELGLFENPYPHEELLPAAMDNTENNKYSHEAACKSITLMKNNGILPIRDRSKKLLVVGPISDSLRLLIGHYTHVALMEMLMLMMTQGKEVQPGVNPDDVMDEDDKKKNGAFDDVAAKMSTSNLEDKHILDPMIRKMYPEAKTILEALREIFDTVEFVEGCDYKGDDASHIPEAVEAAKHADIVIMAVGGKNGLGGSCTTGEAVDSSSLDLMGQQEKLMREVFAANPNMVIVHTDGRPLCSEWAYENVPAIIEGWLPAIYGGQAIAEVISGIYNPAGRTPLSVPRSAGHLPLYHYQNNGSSAPHDKGLISTGYIDSNSTALASFGHGLSYTEFAYRDFSVKKYEGSLIKASVVVENIGAVDGEEVVQLYGKDLYASVIRPRQELAGFKRVSLKAGESKRVVFMFDLNQFAFEDADYNWILEKGDFEFFVGGSSDDQRLSAVCRQEETISVNPTKRSFYAEALVEAL